MIVDPPAAPAPLDRAIPRLHSGIYVPDLLLECRRRAADPCVEDYIAGRPRRAGDAGPRTRRPPGRAGSQ